MTLSPSVNRFSTDDSASQSDPNSERSHREANVRDRGMDVTLDANSERLDYASPNPATHAIVPWPASAKANPSTHSSSSSDLMDLESTFLQSGDMVDISLLPLHETPGSSHGVYVEYPTPSSLSNSKACLCDPTSLRIIESFKHTQLRPADTILDRALLLLRSGVSMCEQSLTCASCIESSSSLASLLLIQDALSCYSSIASQIHNTGALVNLSGVAIGCFEIDGTLQSRVVAEVVKAEMQRGINVLRAFEEAARTNTSDSLVLQAVSQLSKALREKFSF